MRQLLSSRTQGTQGHTQHAQPDEQHSWPGAIEIRSLRPQSAARLGGFGTSRNHRGEHLVASPAWLAPLISEPSTDQRPQVPRADFQQGYGRVTVEGVLAGYSARPTDQIRGFSNKRMEAPPGFEPGMEVLQTSALPLGYGAVIAGWGKRWSGASLSRDGDRWGQTATRRCGGAARRTSHA